MKEAKKRMKNVVTIERNKLFDSKLDASRGNLKTTFKIANQLLNKSHYSKLTIHTNRKTLANSFKKLYKNKVTNIRDSFKLHQ